MKIFYIDEYGEGSMSPRAIAANPCFALCAFCIAETSRISLAHHVRSIKTRFFPGWEGRPWNESEIKGRYLRAARRHLGAGNKPYEPAGYKGLTTTTLNELVRAIGLTFHRFNPIIYLVAVRKNETHARHGAAAHNPIALAYLYLQQRASLLIEDVYGSDEGCIFIADEQYGHERLFTSGTVASVRQQVLGAGAIHRQPNFEVIFDKPLWVRTEELPADREILQLADVATHLIATAICSNNWTDPWLRDWIMPYVARHWTTGLVWGAGITFIPRPAAYPVL
jgi:hypothetical protein